MTRRRHARLGLALTAALAASTTAQANHFAFDNMALPLGLEFSQTDVTGTAWADVNNDGWQDLFLAGHQMDTRFFRSRLYLNQAGEGFRNVWPTLQTGAFETDAHGSYWVDFDNDGDQDLSVIAGGGVGRNDTGSPNLLFEQHEGRLHERGAELGLARPFDRGRAGLWYDHNGDGLLDLLALNGPRPDATESVNRLWLQSTEGFSPTAPETEQARDQGGWQLLLAGSAPPATAALPITAPGGTDVSPGAWLAPFPRRVVQADLKGDGELDYLVYHLPRLERRTCHARGRKGTLIAYIPRGDRRDFEFESPGPLRLSTRDIQGLDAYLGGSKDPEPYASMTLAAFDTRFHVEAFRKPPGDGVAIQYLPTTQRWRVSVQQPEASASAIQFLLSPVAGTAGAEAIAPPCSSRDTPAPYFAGSRRGQNQPLEIRGFAGELSAQILAPGDFDNDGDIDLYALRATAFTDLPDQLLENDGSGGFTAHPVPAADDYDAPGLFVREIMPGAHLALADYNNDGRLDLYLGPRHLYGRGDEARLLTGVPGRLLRNGGTVGNWLQLSLVGQASNRDAIGTVVRLRSGDRWQTRVHHGGIDSLDQHWKVMHFGLGGESFAAELDIRWPSGKITRLESVRAGQRLTITEPQ